jgi:hypothetical protein
MKSDDSSQVDLLGIFHYIVGGMTAFFACFPLIHVAIGLAMVLGKFDGNNAPPPPAALGWLFVVLGGAFVLFGWMLAIAILVAGRKLRARSSRMYCLVVGAVECMMMPFGTVLGVFTIIVLMKDSVKELFERRARGDPALQAGAM